MVKFFTWLVKEAGSEGWKIFYYGACLGVVTTVLFCFPFRYKIIETDNPHMRPIWLKFDRLTGTAWKTDGYSSEWYLVTNHVGGSITDEFGGQR